jgi:hypothetical protein
MEHNSFSACIVVMCIIYLNFITINSHILSRQTNNELKNDEKEIGLKEPSSLINLTISNDIYIFMGKVLKSFKHQSTSSLEYQNKASSFPKNLEKGNDFVHIIKLMRIFNDNGSLSNSLNKVLVITQKPVTCNYETENNFVFNQHRCVILIFAKRISFAVFNAESILTQTMRHKKVPKQIDRVPRMEESKRLRKGRIKTHIIRLNLYL